MSVGSIVGCGLGGGMKNIQWSLFKSILMSWLVTLPFTGLLSAGLFSYGYYSPYDNDNVNDNVNNITLNSGSGSLLN